MKKEVEAALTNVEAVCANAKLNRNEHLTLVQNIKLLRDTIEAKPKKKDKKNAND